MIGIIVSGILLYMLAILFHLPVLNKPARWCVLCYWSGLLEPRKDNDE